MTRDEALQFAEEWIAAWNAHDLNRIMAHYEEPVELISPVAARLLSCTDGKVRGKENLRDYFQRGLQAYPQLQFHLLDVLAGMNSLVLYYKNHEEKRTAEFMEFSPGGKVARVVANYGVR